VLEPWRQRRYISPNHRDFCELHDNATQRPYPPLYILLCLKIVIIFLFLFSHRGDQQECDATPWATFAVKVKWLLSDRIRVFRDNALIFLFGRSSVETRPRYWITCLRVFRGFLQSHPANSRIVSRLGSDRFLKIISHSEFSGRPAIRRYVVFILKIIVKQPVKQLLAAGFLLISCLATVRP
jgi:hypothetical protein